MKNLKLNGNEVTISDLDRRLSPTELLEKAKGADVLLTLALRSH